MSQATPSAPRIELRRLTKRYPSGGSILTVLNELDLTIQAAESVAILGPSGSGKSTLLALMAGLERPSSGQVLLDGTPIHHLSEDALALIRRKQIGFVFQSFQLLSNMTARENVLLPLELIDTAKSGARADELLTLVGLGQRGHHYPTQLSGGEQQRVALARAFAGNPSVLLADEPTGNLDRATGEKILAVIRDLKDHFGTTLVLVTHDIAVARLADRQVFLQDGGLVEAGDNATVLTDSVQ